MGQDDVPVLQFHPKHRVGKGFLDLAIDFDRFFFCQSGLHQITVWEKIKLDKGMGLCSYSFPKYISEKGCREMDESFLRKMKNSLVKLKEEILRNLAAESEDFRNIIENLDPKDLADIAADDIDRKTLEALGSQELKRLQLIESALARIENRKYGICAKCSKKIPRERLEAIPYALLCIECKASEERRNR
jgi:DnaK suppressor protein